MRFAALHKLPSAIAIVLLSQLALGQLVVDATVPIRGRLRNPTSGRAGGIGHKLPLRVTMSVKDRLGDGESTEVDFTLTNTGKVAIALPISPHPRDLEPVDPSISYTVRVLSLVVTSGTGQNATINGTTHLYSSQTSTETSVTLAPGESLRVLTRATFPHTAVSGQEGQQIVVGHLTLSDQTIKSDNSETSEDSEEVGSADSAEYTMSSLTAPHN
jgi:hypothetical protein